MFANGSFFGLDSTRSNACVYILSKLHFTFHMRQGRPSLSVVDNALNDYQGLVPSFYSNMQS